MALDPTVLKTLMLTNMDTAIGLNPQAGPAQRDAIFQALAEAIVTHILTATVTVTVASVSGVTVGPGVSGPGAGTGSIS